MLPHERTPRQRLIDLLTGARLSSFQLAQMLGIPERQVEDHLPHVVKTIARDKTKNSSWTRLVVRIATSSFATEPN